MSIAIVCMVNNTALGILNYKNTTYSSQTSVLVPEECYSSISHHKPIVKISIDSTNKNLTFYFRMGLLLGKKAPKELFYLPISMDTF